MDYQLAQRVLRFNAFGLDLFFLLLSLIALGLLFPVSTPTGIAIAFVLSIAFFLLKDTLRGVSPGKWVSGIVVRDAEDPEIIPSTTALIKRNISLLILPLDVIALFENKHRKRFGDQLANTAVYHNSKKHPGVIRALPFLPIVAIVMYSSLFEAMEAHESFRYEQVQDKYITRQPWKTTGYISRSQILLTNEIKLNGTESWGASSFLIEGNDTTYLCTAKHLLGEDMGFIPPVKTTDFYRELNYWYAYPRQNTISTIGISCTDLRNTKISKWDIILLNYETVTGGAIQPLKPRFTQVKEGEKIQLVACEYADSNCNQKIYPLELSYTEGGSLFLKGAENIDYSGFSGAPLLDQNGYVVGVLSGVYNHFGKFYFYAQSIVTVQEYLQ